MPAWIVDGMTRLAAYFGGIMLKERRRAADIVKTHFLKAEAATDQAAILLADCMASLLRQRSEANLPVATGLDAIQLVSDASADLVRARHRLIEAHRSLVVARGSIGLRAYGDEDECPPSGISEQVPLTLVAAA